MQLHLALLGKTAVETLTQRATQSVFSIGTDKITRADLAQVACYNFVAATHLHRVLNQELQVKNLREVYNNIPPHALALPGLGVIALATLGACFEALGIGTLQSYAEKHADDDVTFTSFKIRAKAADTTHKSSRRRRTLPPAARRPISKTHRRPSRSLTV